MTSHKPQKQDEVFDAGIQETVSEADVNGVIEEKLTLYEAENSDSEPAVCSLLAQWDTKYHERDHWNQ